MKIDRISQIVQTPAVNPEISSKSRNRGKLANETRETADVQEKPASAPIGEKKLLEAIEKANDALNGSNHSFRFYIHKETKQIMIKVIDNETSEIIKEIPPEEILDAIAKMWEIAGLFVDEKR
ncbi:MAG: flagellar protein FlaG [Peptococcaceae bacterium]|nr:MAG: flagellar protein FlaG [Peptococcaceae bacterium]